MAGIIFREGNDISVRTKAGWENDVIERNVID